MIGMHKSWDERVKANVERLKERQKEKPPMPKHWGYLLLEYVRRDSEAYRERWRSQ